MTRRMIQWIASTVRTPYTEPATHFHQGPQASPAVCFNPNCPVPRLELDAR